MGVKDIPSRIAFEGGWELANCRFVLERVRNKRVQSLLGNANTNEPPGLASGHQRLCPDRDVTFRSQRGCGPRAPAESTGSGMGTLIPDGPVGLARLQCQYVTCGLS